MLEHPARRPGRLGVGVVGAGRVGAVLGSALRAAGHAVVGASAVSQASRDRVEALLPGVPVLDVPDVVERAELVLLAVPDDALGDLVAGLAATGSWQAGQLVVHTSGRHGVGVLVPARAAGAIPLALHPVMTFTGTSIDLGRLADCCVGVTAPAPVLPVAQALVVEMGAEPVVVPEQARPLYHAALAHGANHLVTLVAQAAELLRAAGVERTDRLLGPLLHAALDGALASGDDALTGPVARGDAGTVAAHREQVAAAVADGRAGADVLAAYGALARATAQRALASGRLRPERAGAVLDALDGEDPAGPRGPDGDGADGTDGTGGTAGGAYGAAP
ncbi:Rossmann-like and DUF2520 domain-containing protein [Quadrisphaera sp. DSM 44207]|uniref:Rossmann-like and DUF2520 domain-containing protein n=1 Tax=Quadrisphaera sp. DSM 44207 TaxID=1881057 RepID=UPI00088C0A48|nr:DUF2520 domain-containing protein [Quadrisphaera sp. DSM 44207]SDQ16686.1 Predicted oxidoreductase, contains short-chain dehydrogenase (SDR) and DUF2520 domains [Quadrisphaera sp. DSM 44207]